MPTRVRPKAERTRISGGRNHEFRECARPRTGVLQRCPQSCHSGHTVQRVMCARRSNWNKLLLTLPGNIQSAKARVTNPSWCWEALVMQATAQRKTHASTVKRKRVDSQQPILPSNAVNLVEDTWTWAAHACSAAKS